MVDPNTLEWRERRGKNKELFLVTAQRAGPGKPWEFWERSTWDVNYYQVPPRRIPPEVLKKTGAIPPEVLKKMGAPRAIPPKFLKKMGGQPRKGTARRRP